MTEAIPSTIEEMESAGWICHRPICDDNCSWPRCMGPRTDDLMKSLEHPHASMSLVP